MLPFTLESTSLAWTVEIPVHTSTGVGPEFGKYWSSCHLPGSQVTGPGQLGRQKSCHFCYKCRAGETNAFSGPLCAPKLIYQKDLCCQGIFFFLETRLGWGGVRVEGIKGEQYNTGR